MVLPSPEEELENYSDYKNRIFQKTIGRVALVVREIESTSLKEEDKEFLRQEIKNSIVVEI